MKSSLCRFSSSFYLHATKCRREYTSTLENTLALALALVLAQLRSVEISVCQSGKQMRNYK